MKTITPKGERGLAEAARAILVARLFAENGDLDVDMTLSEALEICNNALLAQAMKGRKLDKSGKPVESEADIKARTPQVTAKILRAHPKMKVWEVENLDKSVTVKVRVLPNSPPPRPQTPGMLLRMKAQAGGRISA